MAMALEKLLLFGVGNRTLEMGLYLVRGGTRFTEG